MTVKCTCSRYCKIQLRLIHHHLEENVTVKSGEHTDNPSDGQRGGKTTSSPYHTETYC